ncbi:unnamed protein product [Litomosoides sigmodontis]|uniref:Cation channel complex component UNC80 N-terminal domain-containing protein n=1 Tax=Litomosoides sigmodontis TaxID=42156 RepID=A0A3P6TZU8_LITSI|nr:unnamed protein product [Litomosoides sigmodontis]
MHVRYLQHQRQTAQRLPAPSTTSVGSLQDKIRSMEQLPSNDEEDELESVPLPIQTFLWRQTNPFLGAKIGKLHEAACLTLERVVVQNILHGLSPSLSDAINSVSRWRFVRATFPHIIQCCASLLSEATGRSDSPMSGSLVKMLYILHWLLLDSANECYDVESRKSVSESANFPGHAIRQYAFSISSIQLFVYMIAPLLNVISEKDLASNFRLESGLKIWQPLWQYCQPKVLCFCAPVKQRRTYFPFLTITKRTEATCEVQGIYLGDANETMARRLSNVPAQIVNLPLSSGVPPPKPPRPFLIRSNSKKHKDEAVRAQRTATSTISITRPQQQQRTLSVKKHTNNLKVNRSSSIVRSVSDYHTSDVPRTFAKSRTTAFDEKSPSLCKGMAELDDALNFKDDKSLSNAMDDAEVSEEKAPLVILQEICSSVSTDFENSSSHIRRETICKNCRSAVCRNGMAVTACKCSCHVVDSHLRIIPTVSTNHSDKALPEIKPGKSRREHQRCVAGETVCRTANKPIEDSTPAEPMKVFDPLENIPKERETIQQQPFVNPQEATYMDVAVIRCLLIKHWAEDGVYWAMKYLLHRLFEIKIYRNSQILTCHSRANSVPNIPRLKLFSSRMDDRKILKEIQYCSLAWDDLQLGDVVKKLGKNRRKQKVSSIQYNNKRCSLSSDSLLQLSALSRRSSMMTSESILKTHNDHRHLERERSDPSTTNSPDALSMRDARSGSVTGFPKQTTDKFITRQFFPEALGSTNFIELNGHINFVVLLKAICFAVERRFSVRIYELALNICESLLEMPETELQSFSNDCINVVLRTYLWLGCPHGCNDGLHSQQGDFLRAKARTILAVIFHSDPENFCNLLISHIEEYNAQTLIDTLHSITGFCRCGLAAGGCRARSGSSPRRRTISLDASLPTYQNNFNESLKGIEGTIIKVILKPVVSKLMNAMNELLQPENMSLYQDVRLFTSFIQEQHGSSFRHVGLSALLDGRPPANQNQFLDLIELKSDNNSEDESIRSSASGTAAPMHIRESASLRRGLFKKREKVQISNTDESDLDSSPSTPRAAQASDEGTSAVLSASPLLPPNVVKKRSGNKLHFGSNLSQLDTKKRRRRICPLQQLEILTTNVINMIAHLALNLLKSVRPDNNDGNGSDTEANDDEKSQENIEI